MLLKFITGSSRMGPNRRLYIAGSASDDNMYPIGHTCGESVDCPIYSTQAIMEERFRTAISTCGEIDDDGDYYGSEDSYGGSGEDSNSESSD